MKSDEMHLMNAFFLLVVNAVNAGERKTHVAKLDLNHDVSNASHLPLSRDLWRRRISQPHSVA